MINAIGYKICLFPNKMQEKLLYKFSNISRGLYNMLLAEAKRAFYEENISTTFNYIYSYYKVIKSREETRWINEMPVSCSIQVCKDLVNAYNRVFNSDFGFPKFKKKGKCKLSFYQRGDRLHFKENNYVKITGIGFIKCQKDYYPDFGYCNPRVSFDGKYWYLSFFICGEFSDYFESYNTGIGLDLGIKSFCTVSDGTYFKNYNEDSVLIKLNSRLKSLQRVISKKYKINKCGSEFVKTKNICKLERRVKLLQRRIHNIKLNYIHNYSISLVRTKPEFIAVEDLDISGMKEASNNLSKSIQKLMWYEFIRQLEYKCAFYGIKFVKVDRYFPSSQICSCCGKRMEMPLSERTYHCDSCGLVLDRDLNAAINIRNEGMRMLSVV